MDAEKVYRYPRAFTWAIELLAALAVAVVALLLGRDLLRYLWSAFGTDDALFNRIPQLRDVVLAINGGPVVRVIDPLATLPTLLPPLGLTALVLLLALLLRNSLPTLRASPRGLLVEFAGGWLPVPWESIKAIKVTESGERFVLLAETDAGHLTGWHRCYSLIYRLGFRPAFLITSAIGDFDGLVKTLLSETDRVARVLENVRPAQLQEDASSPLFRLLLSPASFFAQRSGPPPAPAEVRSVAASGEVVRGAYPGRITAILTWGTGIVAALVLVRYVVAWLSFLALTFPQLRLLPVFDRLQLRELPAPWWLLVAAHLVLFGLGWLLLAIRNLLPELEARREGLVVRYFGREVVAPWQRIRAVKVTEFSERSQVVLIQFGGGLPAAARLASLIYDGSLAPGVLLTSALSNFEPLLQRVILEVMRHPGEHETPTDSPIFQSEARSDLLLLSFQSSAAIDRVVEEAKADEETKALSAGRVLRAARPMVWLALLPALMLFGERALVLGVLPDARLVITALVLFLLSMLEWPLVALGSIALDEMTGGGEEGNRAVYLYPLVQLPRSLPLLGALVLLLVGVPAAPTLLWLAAIGWSFLLAAGLWGDLYDWRGGLLLAGGLIPVAFQLFILVGYLIVR
ncbi:MAG TPA: hypothetical protein VNL77_22540 [Roseiflexaceae bacterium]|nr:hypothetical protein [Roseiflexaceae bacterium]